MAHHKQSVHEDRDWGPDNSREEGATVVTTVDLSIANEAESRAEGTRHPDTTVVAETTGVVESVPVYLTGVKSAPIVDRPARRDDPWDRDRDRDDDDD